MAVHQRQQKGRFPFGRNDLVMICFGLMGLMQGCHGFLVQRPVVMAAIPSRQALFLSEKNEQTLPKEEMTDESIETTFDSTTEEEEQEAVVTPQPPKKSAAEELAEMQRRNIAVAIVSVCLGIFNYVWEFTHPLSPVQLLATMQQTSDPVHVIGANSRPSVVDFWAPWCEDCKQLGPTLRKVEEDYKDKVNFIMINGDTPEAWPLIEAFGVDAIPHLALVNSEGDVETALIGRIPKSVLEADLEALVANSKGKNVDLPYKMLDVFETRPDQRRIHFDP